MARKDIVPSPHTSLEAFKQEEDALDWLSRAHEVIKTWHHDSEYLSTALAKGLKAAYEQGLAGAPIKTTAVQRRTRPATPVRAVKLTRRVWPS